MIESPNFPVRRDGDQLTVLLPTRIVADNRGELRAVVLDHIADGARRLVFDFADCRYADSSGLGSLVSLRGKAVDLGGGATAVHLDDDLTTLFQLTRIAPLFGVTPEPHGVRRGE